MKKEESFVITHSGQRAWPFDAERWQPNIEDIAHSLANQARFNGHGRFFYSVAQHCCLMAQFVKHKGFGKKDILRALLHDAAEAYFGDIVTPVKSCLPLWFRVKEEILIGRIYHWAIDGLKGDEELTRFMLNDLDNWLFISERQALFGKDVVWETPQQIGVPVSFDIKPWDRETARLEYLKLFRQNSIRL